MKELIILLFLTLTYAASFPQVYIPYDYPDTVYSRPYPIEEMPFCLEGNVSVFPSADSLPPGMKGYAAVTMHISNTGKLKNFSIRKIVISDSLKVNAIRFCNVNWIDIYNAGYTDTINEEYFPPHVKFLYRYIEGAVHSLKIYKNNRKNIKADNYIEVYIFINRNEKPLYYSYTAAPNEIIVRSEKPDHWYTTTRDPALRVPYFLDVRGTVSVTPEYKILSPDISGFANVVLNIDSDGKLVSYFIRKIILDDKRKQNVIKYEIANWRDVKAGDKQEGAEALPYYAKNLYSYIENAVLNLKIYKNPEHKIDYSSYMDVDIVFNQGFKYYCARF